MCGWITHFLHTLLIHWCCTQHASTPAPVPSHHLLLKSLQIYTEKIFEIKLAQGKKCNFLSRAVAVWQALGPHPASWSNWNSGLTLLNSNSLVWTEICCSDCRRQRGRLCVQSMCIAAHTWSWGPLHHATECPVGQRSTRYCSFLSANFWANAQAIKAGCRSNDRLKFLCVTAMLRSPLYH